MRGSRFIAQLDLLAEELQFRRRRNGENRQKRARRACPGRPRWDACQRDPAAVAAKNHKLGRRLAEQVAAPPFA
jgi:hypothetical protein